MTYQFPESLTALRKYLKSHGFEGDSVKTPRQAAFVAQQLLGTRVRFPPQGQDMMPVLIEIQKAVPVKETGAGAIPAPAEERASKVGEPGSAKKKHRSRHNFVQCDFSRGVHIFCDGACEPNPGAGGWSWVMYIDGVEFSHASGGDPETTNNQMELAGLLNAIEKAQRLYVVPTPETITIWCDSQYCVEGANVWVQSWKARGWNKKKLNSPNRAVDEIKNLELWQAIDAALGDTLITGSLAIKWVKGHAGFAGNERADELAEIGRREALEGINRSSWDELSDNWHEIGADDLDERYRQIMGAA